MQNTLCFIGQWFLAELQWRDTTYKLSENCWPFIVWVIKRNGDTASVYRCRGLTIFHAKQHKWNKLHCIWLATERYQTSQNLKRESQNCWHAQIQQSYVRLFGVNWMSQVQESCASAKYLTWFTAFMLVQARTTHATHWGSLSMKPAMKPQPLMKTKFTMSQPITFCNVRIINESGLTDLAECRTSLWQLNTRVSCGWKSHRSAAQIILFLFLEPTTELWLHMDRRCSETGPWTLKVGNFSVVISSKKYLWLLSDQIQDKHRAAL